jgi:SAM-dependent methyltransferase
MNELLQSRDLAKELSESEYIRARALPSPSDGYYLHLSDLKLALDKHATDEPIRILDFGAGGSPYSVLFPNADFRRADFGGSAVDFTISPDGHTNAPSETFDIVLSTQVLEHCRQPAIHLAECMRMLRPGGKLLLTTHGIYQDHGCPYDYRRWTADGLREDVTSAGFSVEQVSKLTANARAMVFFVLEHAGFWCTTQKPLIRLMGRAFYKGLQILRRPIQALTDRAFPDCRVVDEPSPASVLYIALLAVARRPVC